MAMCRNVDGGGRIQTAKKERKNRYIETRMRKIKDEEDPPKKSSRKRGLIENRDGVGERERESQAINSVFSSGNSRDVGERGEE